MTNYDTKRLFELAEENIRILTSITEITDLLNKAIIDRDISRIQEIIDIRGTMCMDQGRSLTELNQLMDESSYSYSAKETVEGSGMQLSAALTKIDTLSSTVLDLQHECEGILTSELEECRSELAAVRRKSDLKQTYKRKLPIGSAAFLDSAI